MPQLTHATVLIVDDNPVNLRILLEHLKRDGYNAEVASNGIDAIEKAQQVLPDIILLDIMMPGINGFETCRRLKANEQTHHIPVIFITALSELTNKVEGFKAGGVDYITKPFEQEEVIARITTHLTIQHQKRELFELNATKDRFISIIAHDIRGSLSSLLGFSTLLAERGNNFTDIEVSEIGKTIHGSAQNTFKLLENLLSWANIQSNRLEFDPEEIDLYDVIVENVTFFQDNAAQKSIKLLYEIEPSTFIYADLNMINTILRNLISNALKFTYPGGVVTIITRIFEKDVHISVQDTGIGISQADMKKLFRIDKTLKRAGTADELGTGLGLMLCKELIEQHEGTIEVTSELDKGTTFQITIPKRNDDHIEGP